MFKIFKKNKDILVLNLGHILEWYDYSLYNMLISTFIINFFHADNSINGFLGAYFVFSIGFIFQPIFAPIIGYIGDRYGRSFALYLTVSITAFASILMGLLPTYSSYGDKAIILLLLARILQSIGVVGEYTGVTLNIGEKHYNNKFRGFKISFMQIGTALGFLLAAIVVMIIKNTMSSEDFISWGWRIPFIFGGVLSFITLILRLKLNIKDSDLFIKAKREIIRNPLGIAIKQHYITLIMIFLLSFVGPVQFYIVNVFSLQTLIAPKNILDISYINIMNMILFIIFIPLFAFLSDYFKKQKIILLASSLLILVIQYPFLFIIEHSEKIWLLYAINGLWVAFMSLFYAVTSTITINLLPINIRYSGLIFVSGIGAATITGNTPLIAAKLYQLGNINYISLYTSVGILLSIIMSFYVLIYSKKQT